MAAPSSAAEPAQPREEWVYLALGLVLGAALCLLALVTHQRAGLNWLAVFMIAAAVGFAELLSRYRDEPWDAVFSPPGIWFILLNGTAGIAALEIMRFLPAGVLPAGDPAGPPNALVAGLGAMVLLRTKLMTIRTSSGTDVDVGPAFLVNTTMVAVNREVDRRRARARLRLVAQMARDFGAIPFELAAPYLSAALLAYQNLEVEERKKLAETIVSLTDGGSKGLPNTAKYQMAGFDFLTASGDDAFRATFSEVLATLTRPRPLTPPAPDP